MGAEFARVSAIGDRFRGLPMDSAIWQMLVHSISWVRKNVLVRHWRTRHFPASHSNTQVSFCRQSQCHCIGLQLQRLRRAVSSVLR